MRQPVAGRARRLTLAETTMSHDAPAFKPSTLADWQQAAQKSAPGGDVQALNWHTPDGITVKPLYTAADVQGLPYANTLPGFEPFVRGPQATMYAVRPWTIRQYAGFSTAEESNAFYRKALAESPARPRWPGMLALAITAVALYLKSLFPGEARTDAAALPAPKEDAQVGETLRKPAVAEESEQAQEIRDDVEETGSLGREAAQKAVGSGGLGPVVPGLPDYLNIDSRLIDYDRLPLPRYPSPIFEVGAGFSATNDNGGRGVSAETGSGMTVKLIVADAPGASGGVISSAGVTRQRCAAASRSLPAGAGRSAGLMISIVTRNGCPGMTIAVWPSMERRLAAIAGIDSNGSWSRSR